MNSPARPDSPSRPDLEGLKSMAESQGWLPWPHGIVPPSKPAQEFCCAAANAVLPLIAHVERLEKALKPFADACNISTADDSDSVYDTLASEKITWRDLRLARATLSQGNSHE